jgi:hypothetical protein
MLKKDQDIVIGGIIILFALFLMTQMRSLSFMQSVYPKILVIFMVIAGTGIIFRAIKMIKRTGKSYHVLSLQDIVLQAVIPGSFLIIMSLLLRELGFYINAFIVMTGICLLQDFVLKKKFNITLKSATKVILFSACCSVGLYVSFNVLLHLSTPTGILRF